MCLILLAVDYHPEYSLVVAANRDEFFHRPSDPAGFWDTSPRVLAGKDRTGGGTWLGMLASGRLAAVTNYRSAEHLRPDGPSRGQLVVDFLLGDQTPMAYSSRLNDVSSNYSGFNLVLWDRGMGLVYSNVTRDTRPLTPGLHGISNHLLDTPWPKVSLGISAMAEALTPSAPPDVGHLFRFLKRGEPAPDHRLPDTGVGLPMERALSSPFVHIPDVSYGTRCSTVVLLGRGGDALFVERTFDASGETTGEFCWSSKIP
jgi:uncharacterized protein with NRDE domain